ncbi:MAG: YebC/PmpR family DNA-binding transcriptional regulator [Acholeplasmataceae bacterium]|mgnify:FL=1|nr:YebC/PmpR family DNA-binding transcriptional regulator [Acholeplasmataceae bacterium]HPT89492.1 YebC/PmpR family DNA-binding transcriptional regulator [Bacilli bacterium]HQA19456.1 YebC/PmpR family DNA-binding transcriptional regulator [Bacilli bacterium]HQD92133.1 YebC/PmpR family DNA-binding transcriptional regulator [Bacilli bacterium]
MGRKWNNIKYQKAANDKQRSKIYSKFGIEIYAAAKSEPDPEINRNLKMVIEKAKTYNVPREIIERAIEKAKGFGGEDYSFHRYEGYGPGGSAIIVDCLTNNVNRTVSEVRSTFSKHGGTLGVSGSVTFMFDNTAIVSAKGITEDAVLEALINFDCEVSEIENEDGEVTTYGAMEDFQKIRSAYQSLGVNEFTTSEIVMLPKNYIQLEGEAKDKFLRLIDALEDLEDVQNVFHNVMLD